MACSNCRHNVILLSLGLLLFCSLSQCTNLNRTKFQENSQILSKNYGERLYWRHGKLLIGLKTEQDGNPKEAKDFGDFDSDYQSDMAWEVPSLHTVHEYSYPKYDNSAVERLLKMDPMVDCSGGYMRLQVQDADSKPGALFFVDRGDLSPLPLSRLPKSCGYKVSSTRRDLLMVAPYDGCFVIVDEAYYVLALKWLGLPVRMSCPLRQPSSNSPMVTCHTEGMVVKTEWTFDPSEVKVNLNGKWEPLMQASTRCGFSVIEHPEGVAISITYNPCMAKRNGMYSMKLSGHGEMKISCPALASANSPTQPTPMDDGLSSTPDPTHMVVTPQVPKYYTVKPQFPIQIWNQMYPLYWYHKQQPGTADQPVVPQPADDKMAGQPFYPLFPEQPLPDGLNPGLEKHFEPFHHPTLYSDVPVQPNLNEDPPQPDYSSKDMTGLYYPEWYSLEQQMPHPFHPFFLSQELVKPTADPELNPTKAPKPEGPVPPPIYLYPLYYPTGQPEVHTTTAPPTVPHVPQSQNYQLFGPYYYPLPSQHVPHLTTTPTPSTQKPRDPPMSDPGTVLPSQNTPAKPPTECLQYCSVGYPICCPQINFHHHLYHFVPLGQNGNVNPPLFPLADMGLSHISGYGPPQGPREAAAPPSRTAFFTDERVSPLYPFFRRRDEKQTYQQPLEGNPATLPERKPNEQTDPQQSAHPYFVPDVYLPYGVDMNPRDQQSLPEALSGETPRDYSELFDPIHRTNMHVPYNMQPLHQSDGPSINPSTPNLLSRIRQYVRQPADYNANSIVKGPTNLGFRSQQEPQLVPYHSLQEPQGNFPNNQPINAPRTTNHEEAGHLSSEPRGYVLLQQSPQGREGSQSFQSPPYTPVVGVSDNIGQNHASNFQNELLNLKRSWGKSDNSGLVGENSSNADLTLGDEPGPLPRTSASGGSNSAPLSQDPAVSGKPVFHKSFRDPREPFLPFSYSPRISHDDPQ